MNDPMRETHLVNLFTTLQCYFWGSLTIRPLFVSTLFGAICSIELARRPLVLMASSICVRFNHFNLRLSDSGPLQLSIKKLTFSLLAFVLVQLVNLRIR